MNLQDFDNAMNSFKNNPVEIAGRACRIGVRGGCIYFTCGKGEKSININKMREAYEDLLNSNGSSRARVYNVFSDCRWQFFLDFLARYHLANISGRGKYAIISFS